MRRVAGAALGVALLGTLTACGNDPAAGDGDGRLRIATTVAPLTSIVASVVGDLAVVEGIVPEGTDSHTFDPPPRVAEVLSRADLIVVNGLHLDEPTKELAEQNKRRTARVVEVGTEVLPASAYLYDFSFPEDEGKPNPHLWTDPTYAVKYAELVRDVVSDLDPEHVAEYRTHTERFVALAERLSTAVRTASATVPRRALLTYHDAYAYFAKTYGWTVVGAVQPKSFNDPTPSEVARLIRQVRAQRVPTIFGSEVFPSKVLEQIGRATGARYEETLRDDDLPGKPGDPEHSWLGLMRYDVITMVEGLGGDASALRAVPLDDAVPDTARYPQ